MATGTLRFKFGDVLRLTQKFLHDGSLPDDDPYRIMLISSKDGYGQGVVVQPRRTQTIGEIFDSMWLDCFELDQ